MENNSDKKLRDKLKGIEASYDPLAWENMEAMLDKKKKRRGFFWLWTGGIAAALLLVGVIGYELGVNSSESREAKGKFNTNEIKNQEAEKESEIANNRVAKSTSEETPNETEGNNHLNSGASISSAEREENVNRAKPVATNGNTIAASETDQLAEKKTKTARQRKRTGEKHSSSSTTNSLATNQEEQKSSSSNKIENSISPDEPSTVSSSKISLKEKRRNSLLQKSKQGGVNTTIQSFEKNVPREETEMFASVVSSKSLLEERIEMDKRAGLLEPSADETSFDKAKDETLPKAKKKNFQYSLGVLASISGTVLGDERQADTLRNIKSEWYNKVTYSAGLTHEFLFFNRFAITNSFLYSNTGFKIRQPEAPMDSFGRTKSYSASIHELQIPIGIKIYPVVKERFRFYIAASIINHIKITEKFVVEKEPYVIPNSFADNTFVSTNNNPFMEGNKAVTVQNGTYTEGAQAEYFGMGGLKRYYASFYASAGVEYIHKNKYVFFTEPMFYMSLNKIGLQEKRKYNIGGSAGFRYQF